MNALLLAAGLGTRLRPLSNLVPKCLVPIHAKPLLAYWLEALYNAGINEFIINVHYLEEQVRDFVKQCDYNKLITLKYEKELLGTAGTVLANADLLKEEAFMLIHADNLCFTDFGKFITTHHNRPKQCEMTMMTFTSDSPSECGIVQLDQDNIVTAFYEKVQQPPSKLANAAVYILEPSVIDFLASLQKYNIDFSTEVLPKFINKIYTFHNDIYHRDIGTLASFALAQMEVKDFI